MLITTYCFSDRTDICWIDGRSSTTRTISHFPGLWNMKIFDSRERITLSLGTRTKQSSGQGQQLQQGVKTLRPFGFSSKVWTMWFTYFWLFSKLLKFDLRLIARLSIAYIIFYWWFTSQISSWVYERCSSPSVSIKNETQIPFFFWIWTTFLNKWSHWSLLQPMFSVNIRELSAACWALLRPLHVSSVSLTRWLAAQRERFNQPSGALLQGLVQMMKDQTAGSTWKIQMVFSPFLSIWAIYKDLLLLSNFEDAFSIACVRWTTETYAYTLIFLYIVINFPFFLFIHQIDAKFGPDLSKFQQKKLLQWVVLYVLVIY